MLVQLSGPAMQLEPNDERDFPQEEAIRLVRAGYAVPVAGTEIEAAVLPSSAETRFSSVLKLPDLPERQQRRRKARR